MDELFQMFAPGTEERSMPDPRKRRYLYPVKVLWTEGDVRNPEMLLQPRSLQISLRPLSPVTMRATKTQQASVLLDFGMEIHGALRILCWAETTGRGVKVRVRFGESVSEAMSEIGGASGATNDHARRDILTQIGMMSSNEIGETGFRFVRLDILEEAEVQLKSAAAVLIYKDLPWRGSFSCSDPLLDRIWKTGAYTVHLNTQEYIWDGIKRDRLVWVGDMHPEVTAIKAVFGEDDAVEKSLDFIREETPLPGWMNGMATYSMWYAMIVADWYQYTGNKEFLEKQREYLKGLFDQMAKEIGEDGKDTVSQGRFLDWPSSDNEAVVDAGVQALHILAAEGLKACFLALGEEAYAKRCDADLEKLRAFAPDSPEVRSSKQACALLALSRLADAKEINDTVLAAGGAKGMSTFMGYYILAARALAGDEEGCLSNIREYWGGMLALGATTFWEDFDVEWLSNAGRIDELPDPEKTDVHATYGDYCYKGLRHSLCHGWAAGVTPWLSEYVLGIRILEPGCEKIRIDPHLGDLAWAKGTYPTPKGLISVSHEKQADGTIRTVFTVPEGIRVV